MNKTLVRLISLLLVLVTVLPLAAGCNSADADAGTTTTTTTTTALPDDSSPSLEELKLALSNNANANAGYELIQTIIKKHYNTRTHFARVSIEDGNACFAWAAGSFVESLAEGYLGFSLVVEDGGCSLGGPSLGVDRGSSLCRLQ